ncbi:DegV domain-containing protein [Ktedonobacter sp. SOSP1-52]|uniref:DegV family protein n=1 Tax=Ktedonobacter sp. SOSP1-52 TaxID=2778366 RepID=UPI0019157709|nr:DegV family protein [Ktedonobacter sp. SOSP1-52]GHO66413.1 DegV domain-containing protein [Ktedonobacter sp. SOSP1-52]
MTVRIVTDSTSDLPIEQAKALGIEIVPLTVAFGDDAYLDNVEMDNAAFYQKLQGSKELPRTSQPAPARFQETFTRLIQEGATGILSVHLTSQLSGTYQSACTARDALPEDLRKIPIEIVDSTSVSVGMGYPVIKAAEEAQAGLGLEEIKAHLVDRLERTRIFAVLDTLEYVRRGGRIGGATAMLGNVLNIKPIISLKEGVVVPVERARTRGKAYARVAQILQELGPIEYLAIAESSEEVGQQLSEALKPIYSGDIAIWKLGAALGTHTGPGTAAISVVTAK